MALPTAAARVAAPAMTANASLWAVRQSLAAGCAGRTVDDCQQGPGDGEIKRECRRRG